jgi:DNA invertase Pin-like site-specific DNA recombinase
MTTNREVVGSNALDGKREVIYISPKAQATAIKPRVAGYARVSSDSDDQLNSYAAQCRYYTDLISKNDKWEFVEVYADEAVTGTSTEKRDDFNRMMADCRRGLIDRIITKSTSRFARNVMDSLTAVRELKDIGVSVLFEKEGIDTGVITSEVLLTLYSAFAQEESQNIAENKRRGNRMHMRNGDYVSSSVPYGYRLIDKLPQICEPEAEIVRRIFREYLSGSNGYEIARGLTEDGVARKDGGVKWRAKTIYSMLRNERYIGDMLLQKNFKTDALPYKKVKNRGELEKVYVSGTHEAIIEPVSFKLANLLLEQKHSGAAGVAEQLYPYSVKLRCGECGKTYRRRVTKGKVYWVCRLHDESSDYCSAERIAEPDLDIAFAKLYNKLKKNGDRILGDMLEQLEKLRDSRNRGNPEIRTINKQIAELSEQNHVMNGLMARGILDTALFLSQQDELKDKLRALRIAKSKLQSAQDGDEIIEQTEDLIGVLEDGPTHLGGMDEALFADIVEQITINGDILTFHIANGLELKERLVRTVK